MSYTTIDDSSKYFQAHGYTGDGGTQDITLGGNSDLQADWIWIKNRTAESNHISQNTSLGITKQQFLDNNAVEGTSQNWGHVNSVSSDGFQVDEGNSGEANANKNSQNYMSWNWKCNGGTTSTNSDGDIDTTVQVNQTAGFSIVNWTAPNATARTIGHGLGAIPRAIIIRARNRVEDWHWFHYSSGTGGFRGNEADAHNDNTVLGDTLPTSSVYKVGTDFRMNGPYNYHGYFFADVQGFSKFGQYYGNGEADAGPFVYTGFKPSLIIIKNDETGSRPFYMFDNARNTFNPNSLKFYVNTADQEANDQAIDILGNGFKVRPNAYGDVGTSSLNHSGQKIVYWAWAENPFVTSGGAPGTAG